MCSIATLKCNWFQTQYEIWSKGKTKAILIVDFDDSTPRVFKQIFRKEGFRVDVAKDGEEAKRKIKSCNYDCALISFVLPDMEGVDLLLFTTKTMPNAGKIVTTGFPSLSNSIRVIEAGADAYFSKPIDPDELIRVVQEKLELVKKGGKSSNPDKTSGGTSCSGAGRKNLLSDAC